MVRTNRSVVCRFAGFHVAVTTVASLLHGATVWTHDINEACGVHTYMFEYQTTGIKF